MSLAVPGEDTARLRLQKVLQQTPLFADLAPEAKFAAVCKSSTCISVNSSTIYFI